MDTRARVASLLSKEISTYRTRTPRSMELYSRASAAMPLGVASSFQVAEPYPVYLSHGSGSTVEDIDGNRYIDYHNGFGTMVVGHAHPAIQAAITRAAASGTHFACTTDEVVRLAEELNRRFGMEQVRFCSTGTEATMDAVRLARAAAGRDLVVKVEAAYHGHHDALMYSVRSTLDALERAEDAWAVPSSRGIPSGIAAYTKTVPFNDVAALERLFDAYPEQIGAVIVEPIMMNAGIILPAPGYLEAVKELCRARGAVLIFDEVKTGVTVAPGGATELFGVQPDLICLAKAIGGGTPIGAFGGTAAVMSELGKGVAGQGTFNGNPLSVAASLATLTEVLTPAAYEHLAALGTRLATGCAKVLEHAGIAAHTTDLGCKGSITFSSRPLARYDDYRHVDGSLFDAYWFWMVNRGIFVTPGKEEQWTISVQHTDEDIDRTIEMLEAYCAEVA
ncbi:MAG TPA: aspartate aminotransferase family protein [Actinomycetota bacterium]|nr:aspartate aminotransferase family protein [Actinomycetota bacterium]